MPIFKGDIYYGKLEETDIEPELRRLFMDPEDYKPREPKDWKDQDNSAEESEEDYPRQ